MSTQAPLQEAEVLAFAQDWYRKLDVHEPLEAYRPLLADDAEFVFPEATVRGFDGFKGWYDRVIRLFFDEAHAVKRVKITKPGADAEVKVVVHWEASRWNPPAARSERILLDAFQTWVVRRSPTTGQPVIARYVVDGFEYAPNSVKL